MVPENVFDAATYTVIFIVRHLSRIYINIYFVSDVGCSGVGCSENGNSVDYIMIVCGLLFL